jgi:threonine dehydratase
MVTGKQIEHAANILKGRIIRTPLIHSPVLSKLFLCDIYLKLESLQDTGSFKLRGALYKIIIRKNDIGPQGVVAASAGNHAQGVALAAKNAQVPAAIVMPEWASISKQELTRSHGGEVIIHGTSISECLEKACELAGKNKTFIHPYDDEDVITGQGTIGCEIFEDLKHPDMIIVPVGGGGLISGISTASKAIHPKTKIIGAQTSSCPSAYAALKKNAITTVDLSPSLADGISVKRTGEKTFRIIKKNVNHIVLVDEEEIASAVLFLLEKLKLLSEGAGAVPLAALMAGKITDIKGKKIVLVVSGGNIDSPLLDRIINRGLMKNGRLARVNVLLPDIPGAISNLLRIVAEAKANVLHIHHDRNAARIPINTSRVKLELETRSAGHIRHIYRALKKEGYAIEK